MAPRQRLSPQASLEEIHSNEEHPPSTTRPLIPASSSNNTHNNNNNITTTTNTTNNNNNDMPSRTSNTVKAQKETIDTTADIAKEHHDLFNLVALPFVVAAAVVDWDLQLLFQGYGAETAFNGEYFWWTWVTSVAYFLVDLIWVSLVPYCVKSPGTIVKHHLVVIAYLFGPIAFPKYRWFMGACLSVEINTFFLILRRVVYKRKIDLLSDTVSACFYMSWIIIRCFVYPAIMVTFVQLAVRAVRETNQLWHWPMIFIPVHFVLCVLNLKWSYDLFMPIIKTWYAKDAVAPTVSSGL